MPSETRRSGSAGTGGPAASARSAHPGVLRKEGEYWTVGYGRNSFRLKDTKGLGYLSHLLRHPGVEFHVLDLVGGIASYDEEDEIRIGHSAHGLPRGTEDLEKAGIHVTSLGDAGEMLDEQAKASYRRRLSELREELEEAKARGDVERAEQMEEEIDALTRELSRAVGLGGRNRRAASASERARQTVTKTIKAVVERIAHSDAALGDIFSRCVRTGTFCSYQPDPELPVSWEFAATDPDRIIEQAEQPGASGDLAQAPTDRRQAPPMTLDLSPFSLAERIPFVGRESEGRAIRRVVDRALTGQGSIVMLWDGPGVGKSRLAFEMAEYASRIGFRCSVGRCYERDEPPPYLPFAEIVESNLAQAASLDDYRGQMGPYATEMAQIAPSLRRIFPDLPRPPELPPAQQRGYLFQGFSEALARVARTHPQLLILEDLHWADESTLALLIYLANRIAQLPAVIIGTYRSGYSEGNQALVRTLEELIRIGVRPLKLGGLSKEATAQMLRSLGGRDDIPDTLASLIFDESQGYPFFVEEVYRHLAEGGRLFDTAGQFRSEFEIEEDDVPENVRLIISRRLARLDDSEKRALAAAAVIGRSFSFQLLAEVSQIGIDELFNVIEKAQPMGIIVPSAEGPERPFTFRHELVRQTLLAGISAPRRQRLHARVAEAIERLNPDAAKERTGEIIDHLLNAGSFVDHPKLIRWLTLAGKSALGAAAFEAARRYFRSALSHKDSVDLRQRADLLANLAVAERGLDHWDVALAHLREVVEIHVNLGDQEMVGAGFARLTGALISVGRFKEAIEASRRGLARLPEDISASRVRLLAGLAQALAGTGAYEAAHEALHQALDISSRLSDPKLEARLLSVRSAINFLYFRLQEAATDALRCEQLGASKVSPWQRAIDLRILLQILVCLGSMEEVPRIADELEPLARKIGQSYEVALCVSVRAWAEFAKAPDLAKLTIGLDQMPKSDQLSWFAYWETLAEIQRSLVDFFRGNWASALSHARASCQLEVERVESSTRGLGFGALFRQMAYAGDRAGAFGILEENLALLPVIDHQNIRGSWWMLALVIEGLVALGEQAKAAPFYPLARELIGTGVVVLWPIFRFTQTIAGMAAAAARLWEAAEEHFRIAMQQAESYPYFLEQAEIRRFYSMMLIDRATAGDREKARLLLREALESYTQIGMPRHIEMARALLDRILTEMSKQPC